MKSKFKELRTKQLSRSLAAFGQARAVTRPTRGWLRAIRQATGLSLREVGQAIGATPQLIAALEKSEERNRITLHSLELVAQAMGCKLVYAIVPKSGTLGELRARRAGKVVEEQVRAVEHTMMIENQAVGGIAEKIAEETKRRLKGT